VRKRKRKRDLTLAEIADLRKRGLREEDHRELAGQVKRFFSKTDGQSLSASAILRMLAVTTPELLIATSLA
jgi:hypothetical protein